MDRKKSIKLWDGFYVYPMALNDLESEEFACKNLAEKISYMRDKRPGCMQVYYDNGLVYYVPAIGKLIVSKFEDELQNFEEVDYAVKKANGFYGLIHSEILDFLS